MWVLPNIRVDNHIGSSASQAWRDTRLLRREHLLFFEHFPGGYARGPGNGTVGGGGSRRRGTGTESADVEAVLGDVVETISLAVEDHDADLIVVGSNDKRFLERLFTGSSVSEEPACKAPRPVLIVR